ncbi:hypothetical protein Pmani_033260 [Petrolisthes manimaculis]|uniref:Uncharacterized protein n=1 Tax=Petrolisthes manimaculis TaxID=1843537 RepID=A0AAE1NS61_9EUCA|nr:hypothetical protein Pmani_033260 [Petrolisthes manimaculis]
MGIEQQQQPLDGPRLNYPSVLDPSTLTTTTTTTNEKLPTTTPTPTTPTTEEQHNGINKTNHHLQPQPQQLQPQQYETYRSRFWILAVFSCIAFMQTIAWGTFGPITESALAAFPNWTPATIAAFPTWGPIIVIVFTIPMMWLTQKLGLRLGVLVCALLLTLGTMLRCFTSQQTPFTILCHISSIMFAFSACMVLSLPAMIAAIWFPPSERITATAVGALMCQLGSAGMYLSPLVVSTPTNNNPSDQERDNIRGDIMILMYIHFGVATCLLIAVGVYFPAKPPSPPSASSAEEKITYFAGIKAIVKNPQLLMVLLVYAVSYGVPVVWIGVLNLSLIEIDIYQEQAMGVAVTAVVCSCVASFITARVTDKMYGHLRLTVIGLLGLSSVFFLWFLLLSTRVITPNLGQAYVAVAGGLCFEYATVPLLVELGVELGYPIPESVTGAALTLVFNIISLIFLGLFQIPDISHQWVSYVLLSCVTLTILPMIFVKETHKRSDTDRKYL